MKTIKIAAHTELLKAIDAAAHRAKRNRSALICDALREHLRRLEILAMEERDRAGYSKNRHSQDGSATWESEAAWPNRSVIRRRGDQPRF